MALQEQMSKLIDKLIKLGQQDKVDWQETADETTFLAPVSKFVVQVSRANAEPNADYHFEISDPTGKTLDEARVAFRYQDPDYQRLAWLYESARRRALNVDEAYAELLSSLGDG